MLELGKTTMTQGVSEFLVKNCLSQELLTALDQHRACDWGDICEEDKAANDRALEKGERILSSYKVRTPKGAYRVIWIITEWDRSGTTILFPEEY